MPLRQSESAFILSETGNRSDWTIDEAGKAKRERRNGKRETGNDSFSGRQTVVVVVLFI